MSKTFVDANYRFIAANQEVNARITQRQQALALYVSLVVSLLAVLVALRPAAGAKEPPVEWLILGFPVASLCLAFLNYMAERAISNLRTFIAVLEQLEAAVGATKVDLVLSDMAPNISGIDAADQVAGVHLAELALDFARNRLKPGGVLVTKLFQGEGFDEFLANLRQAFDKVVLRKPKASRPRSREIYLVARGLRVV